MVNNTNGHAFTNEQIYIGAVANRCDYEFNWRKIHDKFIPERGEFIIYAKESNDGGSFTNQLSDELDILYPNKSSDEKKAIILEGTDRDNLSTYDRIKLGDGSTLLKDLEPIVTNSDGTASSGGTTGVTEYKESVTEEEGINADWIYRKWSSGKCELMRTVEVNNNNTITGDRDSITTVELPFDVINAIPFIYILDGEVSFSIRTSIVDSKTIKLTYDKNSIGKFSIKVEGIWC